MNEDRITSFKEDWTTCYEWIFNQWMQIEKGVLTTYDTSRFMYHNDVAELVGQQIFVKGVLKLWSFICSK